MSIARHHAEWLSLLEVSGPFLSMPVLLRVFPQGLDAHEPELSRFLRMAYDEWADNQAGTRPDPAIHRQWLRYVLMSVLDMPREYVAEGPALPLGLFAAIADENETVRPDMALVSPDERKPRLLIQLYAAGQDLEKPLAGAHWKASPATRMMELLRATGVRLGLITNGERWMLVDAPANETTGFASWYAALWLEEPVTLRAFRSLLRVQRFFGVPDDETLEALLSESANNQQEVTNQLGYQVRQAVEVLVQSLDRIDKDRQRTLLGDLQETELYEAALTVMMRLVFLLSAEERGMLLLGELLYDQYYAISTLQAQLRKQADQYGEEVLERRHDAWSRLLAVFRVVYGGVQHQDLRLPAYGGHLFDPDRYAFLEGRTSGTSWREQAAEPLLIDNRTVLHLLEALQFLQVRVQGGSSERRRLSFRALDIEQIGHVYEGLLDHTARRAQTPVLGLFGSREHESEVALAVLEQLSARGEPALLDFLEEQTGRSRSAIKSALAVSPMPKRFSRSSLMAACDNNAELCEHVLPFAGLLRTDTFGRPVVITAGSVYVTQGSDRRSTGTHYTPRSLTEPIVQHTLDPLVYVGPAEGKPPAEWQLRPAADILKLKVCDFAMGSGAFLVQTCRYLSAKLVQAWENAEQHLPGKPHITPDGQPSSGAVDETLLPKDADERLALATRLIAERCIYGVDKNPLAVEMAKLSLWLITLDKNKPFTFLDHALRCGDSLLGVNLRQLNTWSMQPQPGKLHQLSFIAPSMQWSLDTALKLRRQINTLPERDVRDTEAKARLLAEAEEAMELVKLGADLLIATALCDPKRQVLLQDTLHAEYAVLVNAYEDARRQAFTETGKSNSRATFKEVRAEVDELLKGRRPFHWPLEFPEVFATGLEDERGFTAIVGNPPFQGGSKITAALGTDYRDYLIGNVAYEGRGKADLCAYFFLRAGWLIRQYGQCGLLATNTIAQGETREVGLDQMIALGWTVLRAVPSRKWPGMASLEVAHVWLRRGDWHGLYVLDEKSVEGITSFLMPLGITDGKPYVLVANADKSFEGSKVYGSGFVLEPEEANLLLNKNLNNKNALFPYLSGDDLNSRFDQSPSRWVINFHNWSLQEAEAYPDCIKIVREKVKPERQRKNEKGEYISRKPLPEKWWIYAEKRPALYNTIASMKRVLIIPRVSKYMVCAWEPRGIVYSDALCVIATESDAYFAIVQCTFHDGWARFCGSTLETRMRYTPSDCFETFPFPNNMQRLEDIGKCYYQHRQSIMLARQEGLTKTYNRFHDPHETAEDIVQLRTLHKDMDEAVARAYGWDDLDLGHGFHETKQGVRYTISEEARREVLGRLLRLNHERYAEEVAQGLHEKGAKKSKKGGSKKHGNGAKENVLRGEQGELVFE